MNDIKETIEKIEGMAAHGLLIPPSTALALVPAARAYVELVESGERVEATDKWFGVAKHPIPGMTPGWYVLHRLEDM